jgi:peptidoglycan hydrolase-like protein with peptidoglycan-binding domain
MIATGQLCVLEATFVDSRQPDPTAEDDAVFDLIFHIQLYLRLAGYDVPEANGHLDLGTEAAIRVFQSDRGLTSDGRPTPDLQQLLLTYVGGEEQVLDLVLPELLAAETGAGREFGFISEIE